MPGRDNTDQAPRTPPGSGPRSFRKLARRRPSTGRGGFAPGCLSRTLMCGAGRVSDGLPGQDEWDGKSALAADALHDACVPNGARLTRVRAWSCSGGQRAAARLSSVALDDAQLRHHDYETREASEQAAARVPAACRSWPLLRSGAESGRMEHGRPGRKCQRHGAAPVLACDTFGVLERGRAVTSGFLAGGS